jgi:hypothetical protein
LVSIFDWHRLVSTGIDWCRLASTGVDWWDKIAKSMLLALNAELAANMPAFVKVPALAGSGGGDENVSPQARGLPCRLQCLVRNPARYFGSLRWP